MCKDDRRWFLIVTGVIGFIALGGFVCVSYPPGSCREARVTLQPPFAKTEGFEFKATLPRNLAHASMGSDSNGRGLSPLTLWENDRPLHNPHAFRNEIQHSGNGSFIHWGEILYFSSSDNSDPNTNGRTYQLRHVVGLPVPVYLAILIIGYALALVLLMIVQRKLSHTKWVSVIINASMIAITLIAAELAAWVMVENQLAQYGPLVRNLYGKALSAKWDQVRMPHDPGLMLNYVPHHYLNYALNPDIAYCGTKQFNAQYHIRRSAPLDGDKGDRWRVLIIGGSTTFAEGIPREQDTWLYILESTIRARCDPRCEVINGGVGGYTILENFVHYIVLLRDLRPDVVLFYTGINDVHPRLFNEIRCDYANYRIPWRTTVDHLWRPNSILESSFLYRYYFLNKVVLATLYSGIGGQVSRKGPPSSSWPAALARNSEQTYCNHLDDFVKLLKAQGILVGVLPQIFTAVTDQDKVFGAAVADHNRVNEHLATEHQVPFARELLAPDAFREGDLADNCHFTEAGCRRMGALVFGFMKEHGLLPRCSTP